MSFDRLIKKIIETKNPTVVGLDPLVEYVPEYIRNDCFAKYGETLEGAAEAILVFNKSIIDEIYDFVIKNNIESFEIIRRKVDINPIISKKLENDI